MSILLSLTLVLGLMPETHLTAYAQTLTAGRITADAIDEGDRLIIVCNYRKDGKYKAISQNVSGRYIYPVDIPEVKDESTSYGVLPDTLTDIPENVAVFKVTFDKTGGMYLECSQGYLSLITDGGQIGIGYVTDQASSSVWAIEDEQYLKSSDYYAEYYAKYSDFTVYNTKYNSYNYQFRFFRVDSEEGETEEFRLPVFETSDLHGCLADTSSTPYQYRMAYIADKVNDVRNNDLSRAVLLDGGDVFQGEMISNRENGRSMSAVYELMKYDAITIGNHDFDWDIRTVIDDNDNTMVDYIIDDHPRSNTVPVVAANVLENGQQISLADPYLILNKTAVSTDGTSLSVKIAVIGFAEDYTQSIMTDKFSGMGYSILDMTESYKLVNKIAADLEAEGKCDATILLAHGEADVIAEALGEDTAIDLVLGGHTHTNILGRTSWGLAYIEPRNSGQSYCYTDLIFHKDGQDKATFAGTGALQTVSTVGLASLEQNEVSGQTELDPAVVEITDYYLNRLN